jgi:hypothetical protein
MGLRAYLLVSACDEVGQGEFIKILRDLEMMPGVDFVDPVVGNTDMVIMIDAPVTIQDVANKVAAKKWCKEVQVLRIVSMFERHHASKKDLLAAMAHSGV